MERRAVSGFNGRTVAAIVVLGSLFVSLSAGCGTRVGPQDDPNATPPPATNPTPTPGATPSATPSAEPSVPVVPTPAPQLQASQKEFKKQLLGWFGKPWVEVMVTNPSNVSLTGTVKVSFTDEGDPTGDDQSKQVTLGAAETQTLKFTATKSNPDAATITVETEAPAGAASQAAPAPGAAATIPGSTLY